MAKVRAHLFESAGPSYHPFESKSYGLLRESTVMVHKMLCDGIMQRGAVRLDQVISDDSALPHAYQTALHLCLRIWSTLDDGINSSAAVYVLERVPHKDDWDTTVCWRQWAFVSASTWTAGDEIEIVINENHDRLVQQEINYNTTRKQVSPEARNYRWFDIDSRDKYLKMCGQIVPGTTFADLDKCRQYPLRSKNNPANPLFVWSIINAMQGIPDAHPDFVNLKNYLSLFAHSRNFKFPHASCCWRMTPQQMRPSVYLSCYLPNVQMPDDDFDPDSLLVTAIQASDAGRPGQREFKLAQSMRDPDADAKIDGVDRVQCAALSLLPSADTRRFMLGQRHTADLTTTVDKLAGINRQKLNKIQSEVARLEKITDAKTGAKSYSRAQLHSIARDMRAKFRKEALADMRAIWNEHANVSRELMTVIRWGESYLRRHKNFCSYVPKQTRNLPLRAEVQTGLLFAAEHMYGVYTGHDALQMIVMSQLNAYHPARADKLNYLAIGPAGMSKSYVLDRGKEMAIPETVQTSTYRSLKCDTGTTDMDGAIIQYHEFPNDHLEANKGVVSDAANMFKDRTTRGLIDATFLIIDPLTSERKKKEITVKANGTYQGNTNMPKHLIDAAILDRMCKMHMEVLHRPGKDINDVMALGTNPYVREMRRATNEHWHKTQYLFAKICKAIELNAMQPVDTSFGSWILNRVLKRARELGLPSVASPRTTKRILMIATTMCILNAIHIVFDSELSPIRNKRFEDEHLLLVEPFLYVSYQEIVMAIGCVKRAELENRSNRDVVEALVRKYFPASNPSTTPEFKAVHSAAPQQQQQPSPQRASTVELTDEERKRRYDTFIEQRLKYMDRDQNGKHITEFLVHNGTFQRQQHGDAARPAAAAATADSKTGSASQAPQSRPSRAILKEHDKIRMIAKELLTVMHPRPQLETVVNTLYELSKMMVKSETGVNDVHLFQLHDEGFMLATQATASMTDDILVKAIKEVLRMARIRKQSIVFDIMTGTDTPFMYRTIEVGVSPEEVATLPSVSSENADFVDWRQRAMLSNGLRNSKGARIMNMDAVYSAGKSTTIDQNMERKFFLQHIANIKWTRQDLDFYGFGDADEMTDRAREKALQNRPDEKLPLYPDECTYDRASKDFLDRVATDMKENASRYSVSAECKDLEDIIMGVTDTSSLTENLVRDKVIIPPLDQGSAAPAAPAAPAAAAPAARSVAMDMSLDGGSGRRAVDNAVGARKVTGILDMTVFPVRGKRKTPY